jgi:FKBP-type peptidyl-prolyl cis-trans isomerase FkpA
MMATGDSASFKISADSLWLKTFHQKKLPPSIKPGTILTFYVKLLGFMNKDEAQKAQMAKMQQQQKEMMQRRMDEWPSINDYLAKNHITAKPDKDSIVYIKRIAGKGRAIHEGDSIYVSYNGTLLNGTVFDKSTPQNPYLKMVYSPGMQLIRGWVIALGSMHEGEQVEMLVPSDLAYGARAMQGIPPFSPLVFDLEVAKVKPAK